MKKKPIGRYIVRDPRICHGQPTFRGTRILVAWTLGTVTPDMAWSVSRSGSTKRRISSAACCGTGNWTPKPSASAR
ncbi:MAG: DUF433 domain-containing protein [Verrucomicrobia bacterium]|nr:DUF433 domain-containing protein [Verrucomicrobiota bacterium]